ncbi:hypothetical protein B566_EDAN016788, partial [Ephemera danica]
MDYDVKHHKCIRCCPPPPKESTRVPRPKKVQAQLHFNALVDPADIPVTAEEWLRAQEKDPELVAIIDLVLAEDPQIMESKYLVDPDGVLRRRDRYGEPKIVSTGFPPSVLTFGEPLRAPFDPQVLAEDHEESEDPVQTYVQQLKDKLSEVVEEARHNIIAAHERHRKHFAVHDQVLKRTHVLSNAEKGVAHSLAKPFNGPYTIVRQLSDNNFRLCHADGTDAGVHNADQLRPFYVQPEWASEPTQYNERQELLTDDTHEELDQLDESVLIDTVIPDNFDFFEGPSEVPLDNTESNSADRAGYESERVKSGRPVRHIQLPKRFRDYQIRVMSDKNIKAVDPLMDPSSPPPPIQSPSVREVVTPDTWGPPCFSRMELKCVCMPEEKDSHRPTHHVVHRCENGCAELCVVNPNLHVDPQISSSSLRKREVVTFGTVQMLQDQATGALSLRSNDGPKVTLLSAKVAQHYWPAFMKVIELHEHTQETLGREINYPMPSCWEAKQTRDLLKRYHDPADLTPTPQTSEAKVVQQRQTNFTTPVVTEVNTKPVLSPEAASFVPAPKPLPPATITSQTFLATPITYPAMQYQPPSTLSIPWQSAVTSSVPQVYAQMPVLAQQLQQQQLQLETQKQLLELRKKVEEREKEEKAREVTAKEEAEREAAKKKKVEQTQPLTTQQPGKEKSAKQKEKDRVQHKARRQRKRQAEAAARQFDGDVHYPPQHHFEGNVHYHPQQQFDDSMDHPPHHQYHHHLGCRCPDCGPGGWIVLTFGEPLRAPFDPQVLAEDHEESEDPIQTYVQQPKDKLSEVVEEARHNIIAAHERHRKQYDKGRTPHSFAVHDQVLKRTHVLSNAEKGVAHSLAKPFNGPYTIVEQLSANNFRLCHADGTDAGVHNADQLRPFYVQPEWASTSEQARCNERQGLVTDDLHEDLDQLNESVLIDT